MFWQMINFDTQYFNDYLDSVKRSGKIHRKWPGNWGIWKCANNTALEMLTLRKKERKATVKI